MPLGGFVMGQWWRVAASTSSHFFSKKAQGMVRGHVCIITGQNPDCMGTIALKHVLPAFIWIKWFRVEVRFAVLFNVMGKFSWWLLLWTPNDLFICQSTVYKLHLFWSPISCLCYIPKKQGFSGSGFKIAMMCYFLCLSLGRGAKNSSKSAVTRSK